MDTFSRLLSNRRKCAILFASYKKEVTAIKHYAKTLKIVLSLLLLVPVFLSFSCGKKRTYQKTSIAYFDTVITVTAYAESQAEFDALAEEIFAEFARYHKLYDVYNEYEGITNLCTVNKTAGNAPVPVDKDIIALLDFGKEIHALTNGHTNIAMGSVLSLWHVARSTKTLPLHTSLTEAATHAEIDNLILDEENNTVFFSDPDLRLDVGAIAKGYAAERIACALEEKGISGVLLDAGGNLIAVGEDTAWKVAVQNPDIEADDPYLQILYLQTGSLVSSGSYQRGFTVDGVRYHHIIDPKTLYPVNTFIIVSVLCPDSGIADALSTALFNLSYEEGLALIESLSDTEAMWQTANGELLYSSGFPQS